MKMPEITQNFYPSNHAGDGKKYTQIVLTAEETERLEVCLFILLVRTKDTDMITPGERKLLLAIHAKLS
jgi:hypothetical protein